MADGPRCALCGKRAAYNAVKHRNNFDDHVSFHSSCIKNKFKEDAYNPVDCLRMLNIPYVHKLWETVEESANFDKKENLITEYIRVIGPRTAYKTFMDSEFDGSDVSGKFEPTQLMVQRWGPKLLDDEYIMLEETYNQLVKLKEPTTKSEESRYIQNAWLNKRMKEALVSGTPQDIKNMQQAYESDLKAIGLDSASVSGRDQDLSLGQRIQSWELEGPTPEMSKEFKDVDKIMKYIEKYFRKPLARNFNKLDANEISEINKYDDDIIPGGDHIER